MKTSFTLQVARMIAVIVVITHGLGALAKDYTTTLAPGVNVTYSVNTTSKIAAVKKVTDNNNIPVTKVTIPATVKYKSGNKTYTLSVTKIRESAFSGSKFETVNIPSGIVSIGNYAFASSKLKTFTIPSACVSLGEGVFCECEELTSITILSQLTAIPVRFAYDCYNLKYVNLPSTVATIGHRAFWMSGIEQIDFPNSLRSIGDQAFERTNLKGLTLPEGLQTVGEACFLGNGDMTYLNLPSTMVNGGAKCFAGLTALATLRCQAVNPPAMGTEAFDKWTSRADIWIPANSADAYRTAPEWCKFNYDAYYEGDTEAVSVHISPSGTITLMDGETRQLNATVMPETTTDKTVVWSSSDPSIATVDANGLVTAHAKLGTAVITGTCGNARGTVNVEVVPTEAHGLSLGVPWPDGTNDYDNDLYVGESWRITAHVQPESLNGSVQWRSSAPNVVSVDQTGLIKALSLGVARITASVGALECGLDFQVTRDSGASGIDDASVETVAVSVDGNTIMVTGDGSASLWRLDGTEVAGMRSADGVCYSGLEAGIYVLRVGKDSRKIAVY